MDRSRKTARTANQPSQGMPQFGIVGFDRISVAFVGVSAPLAGEIDERFVGRESIGIMLFCLGRTVEHGLPTNRMSATARRKISRSSGFRIIPICWAAKQLLTLDESDRAELQTRMEI